MSTHRDRWIECRPDERRVRGYYFPWGSKRIRYRHLELGRPDRLQACRRSVAIILSAAAAVTAVALPTQAARPAARACGWKQKPPATAAHVIWIWMENRSYHQIIGNSAAPFINALARSCGLATNYRSVAHPSLPNYIAATSGGSWGIGDDGPPAAHPLAVASIFAQARSARSYEESMPNGCDAASTGDYAVKHNPEAYYTRIRTACRADDLPLGTPTAGPLARALATGALPAFAFVTPNLCDDMHDCPTASGDRFLARWLPTITASPAYRAATTVVFITWDEDDGTSGDQVATIVVSPSTRPGTRSRQPFTHYSLLRTTEELLGIRAHLGLAAAAASMRTAFNL
jgi:phospholipase C